MGGISGLARAAQTCAVVAPGVQLCEVAVAPQLQRVTQECPMWCWAASISAIFDFYGHPVPQEAIVQRVFGAVACVGSGPTINIGRALSVDWVDANGNRFSSRVVGAYDPGNGINTLNNVQILNEIGTNRPMLYCNTHHAMVIHGLRYIAGPMPNIREVAVTDPWPASPAYHPLSGPEMVPSLMGGQMTFLAAVRVD